MATRSLIGIKNDDGTISAIYCHYDGYPEYNGMMLKNFYKDEGKVRQLIALGDISCLKKHLFPHDAKSHTFDHPEGDVTIAYHRDRGEDLNIYNFLDESSYIKSADNCDAEYIYIYKNNTWYYLPISGKYADNNFKEV